MESSQGTFNINAATNGGVTPLMLAVKANRPVMVEKLLETGADPFLKDKLGDEAMDYHFSLEEINHFLIFFHSKIIHKKNRSLKILFHHK